MKKLYFAPVVSADTVSVSGMLCESAPSTPNPDLNGGGTEDVGGAI
jgi:hypothetical protein